MDDEAAPVRSPLLAKQLVVEPAAAEDLADFRVAAVDAAAMVRDEMATPGVRRLVERGDVEQLAAHAAGAARAPRRGFTGRAYGGHRKRRLAPRHGIAVMIDPVPWPQQ